MKTLTTAAFALLLFVFSSSVSAQSTTSTNTAAAAAPSQQAATDKTVMVKKRGPIFRSNKEQVKQAQMMLKQRGLLESEPTGRLDVMTRGGLRKFQEAESLKVTGTLNRATLEKMNITLTEKQRAM